MTWSGLVMLDILELPAFQKYSKCSVHFVFAFVFEISLSVSLNSLLFENNVESFMRFVFVISDDSSLDDGRHPPLFGNISYEGSDMMI